uniref:Uncharacterized protein n=1 Tax=Meloidogyne floridensis TaxID=298350 RepID=A0A915P571_9BILA
LGIDESMRREMNKDFGTILTTTSLPGLGGPTNSSTFDQNKKQGGGQFGGRQQPKRNQRQFERMWMVARPGGGQETFEDYEQEEDEDLHQQQQYLNNEQSGGGGPLPPQHFNYLPQQQNHLIRPPLPPPQFYHHQTIPPPQFTRPRGDGSGTRKSSSFLRSSTTNILPTLFASLVFLFLLGQVKGDDGGDGIHVGFFNHTLKDGMVTLSEGTHTDNYILLTNEDFIAPSTTTTATTTKLPEPTKSDDLEIPFENREIPFGFFNHTLKGEMVTLAKRVKEVNENNIS